MYHVAKHVWCFFRPHVPFPLFARVSLLHAAIFLFPTKRPSPVPGVMKNNLTGTDESRSDEPKAFGVRGFDAEHVSHLAPRRSSYATIRAFSAQNSQDVYTYISSSFASRRRTPG